MQRTLFGLVCTITLIACQPGTDTSAGSAPVSDIKPLAKESTIPANDDHTVARIQGMPVMRSMIDEAIKLKLYDLEWAKYELRRASLASLVEDALKTGRVAGQDIEVLIQPPQPPRLPLESSDQPSYGSQGAPVTLSIFCSYQSTHCGRMQATYHELEQHYGEQLRFVFYDFPQPFHARGPESSRAVRCADQQGKFWPFHKALWAQQSDLGVDLYQRLATQLAMDQDRFKACMEQPDYAEAVQHNTQMAQDLGFANVPVTLVNGLYLSGPKTADTLRFFVDQELARLNLAAKEGAVTESQQDNLPLSALPVRLEGVLLSEPSSSMAMIRDLDTAQLGEFREDQPIRDNVFVVLIESEGVVLENAGRLEYLPLTAGVAEKAGNQAQHNQTPTVTDTNVTGNNDQNAQAEDAISEEIRMAAESQGFKPRAIVAPQGETPLSREWLDRQLQDQTELEAHFRPTELEVEGVHVLKLQGVEQNEFYQTLGLKEGDVVLRVNNEWVHEAQNNLFARLEHEQEVSVVLMRRGLPVHLKYAIN